MVSIAKYSQEIRNGKIHIHSQESSICPICLSDMRVIGSRDRKVIGRDGQWQTFVIRRLRCKGCGHIHHELPDFLIPYKRHCTETIEEVVSDKGPENILSRPTAARIRAWWKVTGQYLRNILLTLTAKYGVHFLEPLRMKEIVRAAVNSHSWVHTRSVLTSG